MPVPLRVDGFQRRARFLGEMPFGELVQIKLVVGPACGKVQRIAGRVDASGLDVAVFDPQIIRGTPAADVVLVVGAWELGEEAIPPQGKGCRSGPLYSLGSQPV